MPRKFKNIFLIMSFVTMSVTLGGCESIDTAMHNVKERIASIDFKTSKSTPANEDDKSKEETTAPNEAESPPVIATDTETAPEIIEYKKETTFLEQNKECPHVSIIEELNVLHQFTNPDRPTPSQKISEVTLSDLKTGCRYNENNVAVKINMILEGKLGPHARLKATDQPNFAYPYFIAITTPNGNIVAKEVFAATMSYDKEKQTMVKKESLRQIIPINGEYGGDLSILIGFQLTEGELAYNRALKNAQPPQSENVVLPVFLSPAPPVETATKTKKNIAQPISIIPSHKPQNKALTKKIEADDAQEAERLKEMISEETSPLEKTPIEGSAQPVILDITATH